MKIVTGHKGEDHVASADFQALNQGMFGTGNYVLNVGNKFSATMPDATHVVITDGEGVMQGVHFRTERGSTDTVEIDAGATGANRIDFVGALYEKDTQGVESVTWAIAKGTAVSGEPTEPTYATGDILAGDSPVFFPMYKITLTGVTPSFQTLFGDVAPASNSVWTCEKSSGLITVDDSFFVVAFEKAFTEDTEVMGSMIAQDGTATLDAALVVTGQYPESSDSRKIVGYQKTTGMGALTYIPLSFSTIVKTGKKVFFLVRKTGSNGNLYYDCEIYYRPATVGA